MYSVYRKSDGTFTGLRLFSTSDEMLSGFIPEDCAVAEGEFDPLSKRVDLATGKVIDQSMPKPNDGWTIVR